MAFQIEEINGKLFKITATKIDAHNERRIAIPLTEDEYDKLMQTLQSRQKDEISLMKKFEGHKTLKETSEKDERKVTLDEINRGASISMEEETKEVSPPMPRPKTSPPKHRFKVAGE